MDLDAVKKFLEKEGTNSEIIDGVPLQLQRLVMKGLSVDLIEPGRVVCSMKVPPRLLNTGNTLHGGATVTLVDMVTSAVIFTLGAPGVGVSVEINVSYLDAAYVDDEIEIDAKALRVGKTIAVLTVDLRKKKTGKLIAQGRHTKRTSKTQECNSARVTSLPKADYQFEKVNFIIDGSTFTFNPSEDDMNVAL